MKILLNYKDIMSLGISQKTAYSMIKMVQETDEYRDSNFSKVITSKKVPVQMFVGVFPEFKKAAKELWGC